MKRLFLDDDEVRHEMFAGAFPDGTDRYHVHTAAEAIRRLQPSGGIGGMPHGGWDEVWLDHDLADHHYGAWRAGHAEQGPGTGWEVAKWAAEAKPPVRRFIIHSWNPYGAARMADALYAAGYEVIRMPFGPSLLDLAKSLE